MTGKTSRISFWKIMTLSNFVFKFDFFSCDLEIFDGSIGCATKYDADEIMIV